MAIDPIYAFSAAEIEQRIAATREEVMAQLRANLADFVWTTIPSPEELERQRLAAMATFLADYASGRRQGRYVAGEAQALPFAADAFDLALSSHFLLLYAVAVPLAEHRRAIAELLRVAPELRIFPLLELGGAPSRHLEPLLAELGSQGCGLELRRVDYEVQRGGHTQLRIVRPVLTNKAIEALVADVLALLLRSPLASVDAPLRHYTPERLYSRQARAGWLEPDRAPLEIRGEPCR